MLDSGQNARETSIFEMVTRPYNTRRIYPRFKETYRIRTLKAEKKPWCH